VRISNEPGGAEQGPWSELLRLQSEFQSRLADETLRYLRRLQGALGPAVPGTVVVPEGPERLHAEGPPGGRVEMTLNIENRQRVHSMTSAMLSPLVGSGGATWFPEVELTPPSLLVAPGEVGTLAIAIRLPAELPPDTYRGSLLLHGFKEGGLPVSVAVIETAAKAEAAAAPPEAADPAPEAEAAAPPAAVAQPGKPPAARRKGAGRRARPARTAEGS
jgi:hypothetical protein